MAETNYLQEYIRLRNIMKEHPEEPGFPYPHIPDEWSKANKERKDMLREAVLEIFSKVEEYSDLLGKEALSWDWRQLRFRLHRDPCTRAWTKDSITNIDIFEEVWNDTPNAIVPFPLYETARNMHKGEMYLKLDVIPNAYEPNSLICLPLKYLADTDLVVADCAVVAHRRLEMEYVSRAKALGEVSNKLNLCDKLTRLAQKGA